MSSDKTKTATRTPNAIGRRATLAGATAAATLPLIGRRARAAANPIVIGWVGPLSPPGGYAEGTNMKNAAAIALEEINAQGGLLGRPVEIVYADTRGMPAEGRTAAERLTQQEGAVAVFGEFHSGVALAEMEVFHKYGIPFMACDVWSDAITAKGYPEVFRNAPALSLIDVAIGEWMVAAGFKNIAILSEKNDVGLMGRDIIINALQKGQGIQHTAVEADPTLTDFTAQILRFKSNTPPFDLFFNNYSEAGAYPMIKQSHDLGFAPTAGCAIYNNGGEAVDPTFWENVGDAGVYLLTENVGLPKNAWNDKTKAFVAKYQAAQKALPSGAVMESYDGAWLLFDAIKTANGTDPKAIIHALETTSYTGVRGKYSFATDKNPPWHYHQFLEAPLTILQYTEAKQSQSDAPVVWPRKYATVDWLIKKPGA
jgi:branched-chain amino acid transport system substrate-binding protein